MKKLYLINNPELFQGENYLNKNKNYFEGWYFKNTNNETGISFIPGISINKKEKHAFIQIITSNSSYYVNYNINDFKYSHNPFYIKIGNNYFNKESINIDINDTKQKVIVSGNIKYSNTKNITTNKLNPNIMGPFSYIPFMECNHAIISMHSTANGLIRINDKEIIFHNDIGYIEKDWGISFPKSYIWAQGNNFQKFNASFMLSIADIPFKTFHFQGVISTIILDNKEYRFTTYNNSKVIKYEINNNKINIVLKKGDYYLYINSEYNSGLKLLAPYKGKMKKVIFESISTSITVTLTKNNKVIFSDTSHNCGLEIVKK